MVAKSSLVANVLLRHAFRSCLLLCAVTLTACSDQGKGDDQEKNSASTPKSNMTAARSTTLGTDGVKLPISLNQLMVALVNQAADPIWVAAWKNPQSEKEWRNLEYLSYQLEVAGALLKIPGTGPLDITWTSDKRWQELSDRLAAAGSQALTAIKTKDQEAINLAGDDIVDVCESCHKLFKPSIPTGKVYGELSPSD